MTVDEVRALRTGDKLALSVVAKPKSHWYGAVEQTTTEGNYLSVRWTTARRADILSVHSPIWIGITKR